jgi:hypothetical protein
MKSEHEARDDDDLVFVCSKCKRASCFQGIFYCDEYKSAGIYQVTKRELRSLKLEHECYWSD